MNKFNNIITIMKKELKRVFGDRRLLITTILLPGIMIYALYSIIGVSISSATDTPEVKQIVLLDYEDDIEKNDLFNSLNSIDYQYEVTMIKNEEFEDYKKKLLDGEISVMIRFDKDFFESLNKKEKPNFDIYYNPSENDSTSTKDVILSTMKSIEHSYLKNTYGDIDLYTVNKNIQDYEVFDLNSVLGKEISLILPFLIITLLFSGAMGIAPESIAGSKERGTIATLLVTPIKRSDIALGKIISLSIISVMSAISSFLGIILSLPKLMQLDINVSFLEIYSIFDYLKILIILIVTVLFIVGLISIVSCYARNMKEANTFILPLYFITMLLGASSLFLSDNDSSSILYLIPMFGNLQCLSNIFNFELSTLNFIFTISSNVIFTIVFVIILTKMFNNEKIMFTK